MGFSDGTFRHWATVLRGLAFETSVAEPIGTVFAGRLGCLGLAGSAAETFLVHFGAASAFHSGDRLTPTFVFFVMLVSQKLGSATHILTSQSARQDVVFVSGPRR